MGVEPHQNEKVGEERLWERARAAGISRRTFLKLMGAGGATAVLAACARALSVTPTPTPIEGFAAEPGGVLPPTDARVVPTACDYCVVGCGYKAYIWPVGKAGGPTAAENALATDFPTPVLSGKWASPNMHNIVQVDLRQLLAFLPVRRYPDVLGMSGKAPIDAT